MKAVCRCRELDCERYGCKRERGPVEELVHGALPMVDRLVRVFLAKRPPHLDRDAIRGAANEALVKAARSFDPARGVPFEAWAFTRVSGAMLDEVRATSHGHRNTPAEHVSLDEFDAVDTALERLPDRLDLRAALAKLPAFKRRILVAETLGIAGRELAREAGVSESAISKQRHLGLAACRAQMAA